MAVTVKTTHTTRAPDEPPRPDLARAPGLTVSGIGPQPAAAPETATETVVVVEQPAAPAADPSAAPVSVTVPAAHFTRKPGINS